MLGVVYNNTSDLLTHHHHHMMMITTTTTRRRRRKATTSQKQYLHFFNVFSSSSCLSVSVSVLNNNNNNNNNQNPSSLKSFSSKNPPSSITVDYLVNTCGLSPERAMSIANKKKFNICSIEKADSVISLFESYGFNKTHITKLIFQQPELLLVDPNKILKPKFDFLCDLGVSEPDLIKLTVSHPAFVASSLNNQIIPCFNFLKDFIDSDADIMIVLKRFPTIFSFSLEKVLKPNIAILQIHGVPNHNIASLLITSPRTLTCNYNRFKEIAEKVKKLGFDPSRTTFCRAVYIMISISESSWDKKLMVFRDFGLLENDVISAFQKNPNFMGLSEENIRRSLEFFQENLKCKPIDIMSRPGMLLFSLEERIIPRCAVLKILYKKGTIRNKLNLNTIFQMTEMAFSEKFVIKYCESVLEVMKAYTGETEFVGFEEVVEVKGLSIKPSLTAFPIGAEGKEKGSY